MSVACEEGHFEIVKWLLTHGADTDDVMQPGYQGKTSMDFACQKGHLNIVEHLIRHHRIPPDTLEQWHPRLSSSDKIQLHQAACENLFHCQSFFTLVNIVRFTDIEPYKVIDEETSCLVLPSSSILRFQNFDDHVLFDRIANYICGGEDMLIMFITAQGDGRYNIKIETRSFSQLPAPVTLCINLMMAQDKQQFVRGEKREGEGRRRKRWWWRRRREREGTGREGMGKRRK